MIVIQLKEVESIDLLWDVWVQVLDYTDVTSEEAK